MKLSANEIHVAEKSDTTECALAPFWTNTGTVQVGNKIGLLLNCGIHASRVVGKGGSKIRDLMDRSGACLRVARNSGLCEMSGTVTDVHMAKKLVLDIVDDGVTRDMRASISQALSISEDVSDGYLMIATQNYPEIILAWFDAPFGMKTVPFVPPCDSYFVPLGMQ